MARKDNTKITTKHRTFDPKFALAGPFPTQFWPIFYKPKSQKCVTVHPPLGSYKIIINTRWGSEGGKRLLAETRRHTPYPYFILRGQKLKLGANKSLVKIISAGQPKKNPQIAFSENITSSMHPKTELVLNAHVNKCFMGVKMSWVSHEHKKLFW